MYDLAQHHNREFSGYTKIWQECPPVYQKDKKAETEAFFQPTLAKIWGLGVHKTQTQRTALNIVSSQEISQKQGPVLVKRLGKKLSWRKGGGQSLHLKNSDIFLLVLNTIGM